uniref:NADH-ubiquinone oxidoreductase chain 3 n=1 Tax=Nuttallina californica TaxID=413430 RepID=A0A0E3DE43_9MOLL|nr:NADH dehydrogenase subunit 3 [Nuttallina californica]AIA77076.1 NADH dehydrogenase subunit 3 [Nuttallina californica]
MFLIISFMFFIISLSLLLLFLTFFLWKKKTMNREKSSPFECGFDSNKFARFPFSMRFFLITVVFLIFDIEIVLLLPYLMSMNLSMDTFSLISSVSVLLILTFGTLYEWSEGSLEWLSMDM